MEPNDGSLTVSLHAAAKCRQVTGPGIIRLKTSSISTEEWANVRMPLMVRQPYDQTPSGDCASFEKLGLVKAKRKDSEDSETSQCNNELPDAF